MRYSIIAALILMICLNPLFARVSSGWYPRVSIITSVYDGDAFIEGFMWDITHQTIFDQCELIMIDANSPGHEYTTIKRYMDQYPNIIYQRLDHDPGLYGVWNYAIKMARGLYITNANLDDRLKFNCYEVHAAVLRANPTVDLVYSDFYLTHYPNETFAVNRHAKVRTMPSFTVEHMRECLPNCHPMWRATFHQKYGFFDEKFRVCGDWELWLRAVAAGALFKKIPGVFGLYYENPTSLSNKDNGMIAKQERATIIRIYKDLLVRK